MHLTTRGAVRLPRESAYFLFDCPNPCYPKQHTSHKIFTSPCRPPLSHKSPIFAPPCCSGDITQRFLPAFLATENMRRGMSPQQACEESVRRIMSKVDNFAIGIVCLNSAGETGAAGHGWNFKYCQASTDTEGAPVCTGVTPLSR